MEVINRKPFSTDESAKRIDDILNSAAGNYADMKSIPTRSSLTYVNGYYVNVTALFIDIVGSADMSDEHKRPVLAKIYRSFISECTAILNSIDICKEISIYGDCVWGVFETPYTYDIDTVFSVSAMLNSLIQILNYKLEKKGYLTIRVGIGIDYGRALMVKAGYSGSGLNDVIWMGDVVNSACHLANEAGRNGNPTILVSETLYSNLNDHNQKLLHKELSGYRTRYGGSVINTDMQSWYEDHCK